MSSCFQTQETQQDKLHDFYRLKRLRGKEGEVGHKSIGCAMIHLRHSLSRETKGDVLPGVPLFSLPIISSCINKAE